MQAIGQRNKVDNEVDNRNRQKQTLELQIKEKQTELERCVQLGGNRKLVVTNASAWVDRENADTCSSTSRSRGSRTSSRSSSTSSATTRRDVHAHHVRDVGACLQVLHDTYSYRSDPSAEDARKWMWRTAPHDLCFRFDGVRVARESHGGGEKIASFTFLPY